MAKRDMPHLTIVGGQPVKPDRKHEMEVPVGLEKLLFMAAGDEMLEADLLRDRFGTIDRLGIRLRPSEAAMLESVSSDGLREMVDRIRPDNPRRCKLMGVVAAAATSLAAGTAVISCDGIGATDGIRPGEDIDGGSDSNTDSDPDAGADSGK